MFQGASMRAGRQGFTGNFHPMKAGRMRGGAGVLRGKSARSWLKRLLTMLAFPFRIRSLKVLDLTVVEMPKPGSNFVDQIMVVGDQ